MKEYTQEEIITSKGRQSRYEVMPLDEDGKPSQYYGSDESPINAYALVDKKTGQVLEEVKSDSYSDAHDELMECVEE